MLINNNGIQEYKDVPGNRIPVHELLRLKEVSEPQDYKGHPFFSLEQRANINLRSN